MKKSCKRGEGESARYILSFFNISFFLLFLFHFLIIRLESLGPSMLRQFDVHYLERF